MSQSETQHSAAAPDDAEDQHPLQGQGETGCDARLADQAPADDESERTDPAGTDDALSDDQLDAVAGGAATSSTAQQLLVVTSGGTPGGAKAPTPMPSIQSLFHLS